MANLILNGSTSGSVTLSSPAVSGTTTLTLPTTSGTVLTNGTNTNFPAGSILQVVSATKTNTSSSGSGAWNAISGLSVTITPKSASNKILIFANVSFAQDGSNYDLNFGLFKNSSILSSATGDASGSRGRYFMGSNCREFYEMQNTGMHFLDSPATTSSTTYDIRTYNQGTIYINREMYDGDNIYTARGISTITVMEVSA